MGNLGKKNLKEEVVVGAPNFCLRVWGVEVDLDQGGNEGSTRVAGNHSVTFPGTQRKSTSGVKETS